MGTNSVSIIRRGMSTYARGVWVRPFFGGQVHVIGKVTATKVFLLTVGRRQVELFRVQAALASDRKGSWTSWPDNTRSADFLLELLWILK